ncbi:hypothetical protein L9F63_020003, partial [Diploptera punctata]
CFNISWILYSRADSFIIKMQAKNTADFKAEAKLSNKLRERHKLLWSLFRADYSVSLQSSKLYTEKCNLLEQVVLNHML